MLEHLDDPNPPRPSELTVERIAAEGARRLRHRRLAASGALVMVSTLAVVGIAFAAQNPGADGDKVDTSGPGGGATTIPDDVVPPTVTATTSTAPTGGDAAWPAGTTPPGSAPTIDGQSYITAIVKDPERDEALVVVLDPSTGATTRTLARFALQGQPPLCCIEHDADGPVYYVVPEGQGDEPAAEATIWRVDLDGGQPAPVAAGTNPAASPDGDRLAFVRTSGGGPAVVVRDVAGGDEVAIPGDVEDYVRDVDWLDDDTLVVTLQTQPESPLEAVTIDVGVASSLADATPLGPPDSDPAGTSWEWIDRRPDGWVTISRTCCSLDAGSYDGDDAYVLVDPNSGTYGDGAELPFHPAGLATGPRSDRELLVDPPAGGPGYGTLHVLMDTDVTEVPGNHQVIAADW